MNLDFKNKEWREFLFSEVFEIKNGFYNKKPESKGKGKIPFIGASIYNNGITEFYSEKEIADNSKMGHGKNHALSSKIFNGNCIVVTNNGSVGYAYYQTSSFTCSHDVNPLYLKHHLLNTNLAKFLITVIEKQRVCFEYARKWRPMRMVKSKILLPVNSKGTPDFEFMEELIKQREDAKLIDYDNYVLKRLKELGDFKPVKSVEEKKWSEFFLKDIFTEIQRGKRLKKADHKKGRMPYVSSTALNNGVDGFIGNKEKIRIFSDCLTIANSGSVGACFYQPFEFVASDHVTQLKNKALNEYTYKFISTIVKRLGVKYSFNREMNDARIKREKILLPINEKREPDYVYMENYIKKIEFEKLTNYLSHKKSEIL